MKGQRLFHHLSLLTGFGATLLDASDVHPALQYISNSHRIESQASFREAAHALRRQTQELHATRFIVEFQATTQSHDFDTLTNSFATHIASLYSSEVLHRYTDHRIFWGASFKLDNKGHPVDKVLAHLKTAPHVENVWPDRARKLMKHEKYPEKKIRSTKSSPSEGQALHKTKPRIQSLGKRLPDGPFTDSNYAHNGNGLSEQFAAGHFGKGIRVCTMDTGVDYSAPSLNAGRPAGVPCLGPGCQVVGGIDLIGDPFDGENIKPKPLDYRDVQEAECAHGTHTAGSIIANSTVFPGAVPQAELWHYKIFACHSKGQKTNATSLSDVSKIGGFDSVILAGLNRALDDNCDILSSSIGGSSPWEQCPVCQAASKLGSYIPVFFSQGNTGDKGLFTGGDPAAGSNVIAVSSGTTPQYGGWTFTIEGDEKTKLSYYQSFAFFFRNETDAVRPLFIGLDLLRNPANLDEGCDPDKIHKLVKENKIPRDLSKHVVLLSLEGSCGPRFKMQSYHNATGALTFFYMNRWDGLGSFSDPTEEQPAQLGEILTADGLLLRREYIKRKGKLNVVFPAKKSIKVIDSDNPFGQAYYTSWGPDWNLNTKPEITAAGDLVLSAAPGEFAQMLMSGTSMSCPLAAGLAAMYKSQRKDADVKDIRSALMFTAVPRGTQNTSALASVFRGGAGWANVTAMLASTTRTEPTAFSLRDSPRAQLVHELHVTNKGNATQKYSFNLQKAQCVLALHKGALSHSGNPDEGLWMLRPEECEDETEVTFSKRVLKVAPGKTETIKVQFHPGDADPRLKFYSGWIKIVSDDEHGSGIVPYSGILGDTESIGPFDQTYRLWNTTLPALYDGRLETQIQNATTKFQVSEADPYSWPAVMFVQALGTKQYLCDLVKADLPLIATQAIIDDPDCCDNAFNNSNYARSYAEKLAHHNLMKQPTYNMYEDVPYVMRLSDEQYLNRDMADPSYNRIGYQITACFVNYGKLPNGTMSFVKDGNYRILLRVQKPSQSNNKGTSFWSYLTHPFEIKVTHRGAHSAPSPKD